MVSFPTAGSVHQPVTPIKIWTNNFGTSTEYSQCYASFFFYVIHAGPCTKYLKATICLLDFENKWITLFEHQVSLSICSVKGRMSFGPVLWIGSGLWRVLVNIWGLWIQLQSILTGPMRQRHNFSNPWIFLGALAWCHYAWSYRNWLCNDAFHTLVLGANRKKKIIVPKW